MSSLLNTLKQLAVAAGIQGEDMKIQFSMRPNAGECGFQQWHGAMKMVARLSGGIPREFRKTLWLTLAERHIISKNINWSQVERTCFNDLTNPDDEELGIQIVKDLHRTGCTLFCGTSGEENQAVLKRVLLAYARWNKFVGYCQGFNMLAALILEVMDRSENNSLKVMIFLIEGVLPESYFANNLQGLSIDMAVFRDLLRLKLPLLSRHLEQLQTCSNDAGSIYEPPLMNVFTMQWFLTMFCNCLPHSTVLRVWDLIFLEGNQMLLKTALAIWDTLSDRIMPVKSADEFYSIMGVLTREMLEFGLMDANLLIKTITSIELPDLTELRERYIYNITPWSQMARKGLRLFYGGDESDNSDDDPSIDDKTSNSEGAYGLLKAATRHGSQSIRSLSPSSILGPFANEKEKIALDISALKKQYSKIKEHQRQAQIIFTAACNSHGFMGSMVSSTTTPAINHLMLSKGTAATSATKVSYSTQKSSSIPVARAVQRLKDTSSTLGEDSHKDRGETLYWNKRMKKRKRRRTEINFQTYCDSSKPDPDTLNDSDSSTTSCSSSSFKSSSSTELCDEIAEFDSEDANTSLSECCPSPLQNKLRSSTVSLNDDDDDDDDKSVPFPEKSEPCLPKADLPHDTSGYVSSDHTHENLSNNEGDSENIFNLLLTTSMIASEQLGKQDDVESAHHLRSVVRLKTDQEDANVPDEECASQKRLNHFIHNMNKLSRTLSDTANADVTQLSKTYSTDDSNTNENGPSPGMFENVQNEVSQNTEENSELESALEHMKIDALEILFSSSTLDSIRNDTNDANESASFSNLSLPVPVLEHRPNKAFQIDEKTELELREILQENTELLKKLNQNYSSYDADEAIISRAVKCDGCPTTVNHGPALVAVGTEIKTADDKESDSFIHCDLEPSHPVSELLAEKFVYDMSYSEPHNELVLEKFDEYSAQYSSNQNCTVETDYFCDEDHLRAECEIDDIPLTLLGDNLSGMQLSPSPEIDFDCKTSPSDSSLYYPKSETDDENSDSQRLPSQKKHKSLDSLNHSKNRTNGLKVGLVDPDSKWISISIDNSDLVLQDDVPKKSSMDVPSEGVETEATVVPRLTSKTKSSPKQPTADPYLYLNFDIIPTRKKKKSPMQEYVNKKNILSQNYRSTEFSNRNYNPFPSRPANRPPKELGVKLGLYSPSKK